jgi:hypothetical protein
MSDCCAGCGGRDGELCMYSAVAGRELFHSFWARPECLDSWLQKRGRKTMTQQLREEREMTSHGGGS